MISVERLERLKGHAIGMMHLFFNITKMFVEASFLPVSILHSVQGYTVRQ